MWLCTYLTYLSNSVLLSDECMLQFVFGKNRHWLVPKTKKIIDTVVYIEILVTCNHQGNVFSQEVSGYFSRTMAVFIIHMLQQSGFVDTDCVSQQELANMLKCNNKYLQFTKG